MKKQAMTTLNELLAQKAAIEQQIAAARKQEIGAAIAQVRAIIEEHQLTAAEVFPGGKAKAVAKKSGKVAPKYKDPATGATWTGRGIAPKWLAGKDKAAFLIG